MKQNLKRMLIFGFYCLKPKGNCSVHLSKILCKNTLVKETLMKLESGRHVVFLISLHQENAAKRVHAAGI
jgi:hypothetical protein